MQPLDIPCSRTTPEIKSMPEGSGIIFKGQSYPENSFEFYEPVKNWLAEALARQPERFEVHFRLDYFNTSSSKCLLDILEMLEAHHAAHQGVQVVWFYEADDEDMQESGEDFGEDLELPFELRPITNEATC